MIHKSLILDSFQKIPKYELVANSFIRQALSSKHQIIDIFERVFFRHTSAIFPHVARL